MTWQNGLFAALVIVVALVAIYYRVSLLQYFGFYEPDGFYYFTVMRAIVNNNFAIPQFLSTSGWPHNAPVAEAHGVYWVTLIPYFFLRYLGVSYYTVMRLVPVLYALLDMFAAYLLSRYLSKDKLFGLLVMLLVAMSMGNAARTSALIYRGDTFVTFYLIMALVFLVEIFRQDDQKKKIIFMFATAIALWGSNLVWDGSSFAQATILLAFGFLMAFAFVFRKDKVIDDGKYVLGMFVIWLILVSLAEGTNFISVQQLTGGSFLPVFASILIIWLAVYFVSRNVVEVMRDPVIRVGVLVAGAVLGVLIFGLVESNLVYNIFVANGFISTSGFGTSIQELQPPNFGFLFTSFGSELFTSLPALVMASSTYFSGLQSLLWTAGYGVIGMVIFVIVFIPYFFMQVYDSGGFFKGNPRIKLDMNVPLIIIMSYFILTGFLQMQIIRFNSLVSVPIAIMSAYTLYWLTLYAFKMPKPQLRLAGLVAMGIVLVIVFGALIWYDNIYSSGLVQADSINPQFLSAMQWLKLNSPNNSVVLTLWPDGSVVEAVANRTTVTDSVGSQNGSKATPFAAWLFNSSPDPQFLTGPINGAPNYLVVRNTWLEETQGIFTEANSTANASLYGFQPLYSYNEDTINSTTKQLVLKNSDTFPYVIVDISAANNTDQIARITGYVQLSNTSFVPFSEVGFYDQYSQNYSLIDQSAQFNYTNGAGLLIEYSDIPRQGFYLNLTGAYILAPGLGQSNMAKFLWFCGAYSCTWDNSQAQMTLVYSNPDTKIFHIIYNST